MGADTIPKLLVERYRQYGDGKVALRKKDFGIWNSYTWKDYYEKVKYFSLGLISFGLKREDKVSIIGENDPQYYWAELAIQAAGGIMVGIFTDASHKEVKYYLEHSDSRFVVAHDQEQVDKIIEVQDQLPLVEKVIYWDPKGLWSYTEPYLISFEDVVEIGKTFDKESPDLFDQELEKGKGKDISCFCYTSGTSGLPKGAMISHTMLLNASKTWSSIDPWHDTDEYLTFIPPAWIAEQIIGLTGSLWIGLTVNFSEDPETVQEDLREIGPGVIFYAARIWENLASTVQAHMLDASPLKKFLFNYFLGLSDKIVDLEENREKPGFFTGLLNRLGDFWIFRPLRDNLGLSRVRHAYTAGAFLSPDMGKFFHALGIKLKQAYGLTEITPISIHSNKDVKYETIGQIVPGIEMKVLDDGQMAFKNENYMFDGYYKDPEKTAEALQDGWFLTGDAGYLRDDGHLIYYDRAKDMMPLSTGEKYSPSFIEGRLKFSPYILDIMIVGTQRPYVSALVIIDFAILGKWAESKRIPYTTFSDLSQRPETYDLIQKEMGRVNNTLADEAKIKRFFNLPKELDPDEGELTRTRKIKRPVIAQRYKDLIDAMYEDVEDTFLDIDITYEDGRKGRLRSPVSIRSI